MPLNKATVEYALAVLPRFTKEALARGVSLRPEFPLWSASGHVEDHSSQHLRFATSHVVEQTADFSTKVLKRAAEGDANSAALIDARVSQLITELKGAEPADEMRHG